MFAFFSLVMLFFINIVPVPEPIETGISEWAVWSTDGAQIAYPCYDNSRLCVAEGDGSNPYLTNAGENVFDISWSTDGTHIAYAASAVGEDSDIYVLDLTNAQAEPEQITDNEEQDRYPTWSPDGIEMAYVAGTEDGSFSTDIWVINVESKEKRQITTDTDANTTPDWSPDGEFIAYVTSSFDTGTEDSNWDIYVISADGRGSPHRVTYSLGDELHPSWSPDGKYFSYFSERPSPNIVVISMNQVVPLIYETNFDEAIGIFHPRWMNAHTLVYATDYLENSQIVFGEK